MNKLKKKKGLFLWVVYSAFVLCYVDLDWYVAVVVCVVLINPVYNLESDGYALANVLY